MIAALVAMSLLGVGGLALWARFYYAPAQHAGSGEGALTVAYRRPGGRRCANPHTARGDGVPRQHELVPGPARA
ncbi:hypothetical protein FDZ84_15335 [Saccharopolyspora sp. ASAGF58]|nr:hypothetical protein FDZ84_15335 [Saccharopolyspora sp. ASAGF58]